MNRVPPGDDRHATGDSQSRQHVKEPGRRDWCHACIDSRVQRRVHETITPTMAVNISTPSEMGSITFQPILINWSKRVIPLLYTYTAEHFPTNARASGIALTDGLGHLGGAL